MKASILTGAFLTLLIAACTNENKEGQTADSAEVIAVDTTFTAAQPKKSSSDCYRFIQKRDTALLKINMEGEELTGTLDYNFFEKDKNKGTIAGEMKGDTIIAEYTFDSEGMRSVREVVFVKKDNGNLYEGTGEVIENGGKTMFKNRTVLKFDPGMVFIKTDCK